MPAYNDVFAAIHVDGQPLEEHQVRENEGQKEVSCWISSQVGKEFSISYKNSSLDKHMALQVLMDGYQATCIHLPPQCQGTVIAFEISATEERPFLFSEGRLVDDDDLRGEIQSLDSLGTIALSFHEGHVKVINGTVMKRKNQEWNLGPAIPDQRLIPERGKKGIQTCVALGPVKTKERLDRIDFTYANNVTRVVFRYRPLYYLQAQGIVPPPPPPRQSRTASSSPQRATTGKVERRRADHARSQARPSGTKRRQTEHRKLADIEISDDEDIERLQALRARIDKALAKKNVRIKKEIKTERVTALVEGEVIDLT